MMITLRLGLILLLVSAFVLIGIPFNALARRFYPRLQAFIPLLFHRCLIRILRLRVHRLGEIAAQPALLIPNHVSWTDISVIGALAPLSFVAKSDVAHWPVFGRLAKAQGTIFVDRNRRSGVHRVNLAMAERLRAGRSVVLFPEGTTGDGNRLLPFFTSHFAAAREVLRQNPHLRSIPVQPVSILYQRRQGMNMDRLTRAHVAWYGDTTLLPHLLWLLRQGPFDVTLKFHPPLAFERGTDRKHLARIAAHHIRAGNYALNYGRGGGLTPPMV